MYEASVLNLHINANLEFTLNLIYIYSCIANIPHICKRSFAYIQICRKEKICSSKRSCANVMFAFMQICMMCK